MARMYDNGNEIVVMSEEDQQEQATVSQDLEKELADSLADGDDTSEVILYRQKTANHKDGMDLCESWSGDVATWRLVQETAREFCLVDKPVTYFRVWIKKKGKIVQHRPFSIASRKKEVPALSVSGDNDTGKVLQAMLAMQERQNQVLAELTRPKDQMAEMKSMLGMMAMMREAMGVSGRQEIDMTDTINRSMTTMQTLFDAQLKMLEMKNELSLPEKEESVLSVIKEFAPQFIDVVKTNQAQQTVKMQQSTHAQLSAPVKDTEAAQVGALLIQSARAGNDTNDEAVRVIKLVPRDKLIAFLDSGALERILSAYPEAIKHASWFAELIFAIEAVIDDTPDDGLVARRSGHQTNAATDATTNQPRKTEPDVAPSGGEHRQESTE